jgi:thiol-disulfide isomerase/thioredoxin
MKPPGKGSKNLNMMSKIATDIVMNKAMKDKTTIEQNKARRAREQKSNAQYKNQHFSDDDFSSDGSLDSDEEEIMRRMKDKMSSEAMERKREREKKDKQTTQTGEYKEISEKEFFELIKNKKEKIIANFFHEDFNRCKILDSHLPKLAYEHPEALFVKIDVKKATFLVGNLKLKVLPTVIFFEHGIARDRLTGFEELGNTDDFKTEVLARRLCKYNAISLNETEKFKLTRKKKRRVVGGESDSEDDY